MWSETANVIGIRAVVLKLQLRHFTQPITAYHCWSLGAYTTTPQPIPALIQPFNDSLKSTREWSKLALLTYSSLILGLSSEKWPFRGFIPWTSVSDIYHWRSRFLFFLLSSTRLILKCGVLQSGSAFWFLWCDRNAKVCSHPCTKKAPSNILELGPLW